MRAYVIGATTGIFQENAYGRIHTISDDNPSGAGQKCVIFKASPDAAISFNDKALPGEYDLIFNQYGKVVEVRSF